MKRYEELKRILEQRRYFKIVCGAGNEDCEEVRKLALIYTLAGATGIDVSANVAVVRSAVAGVERACALARSMNVHIASRPFINVSIGMRGDPHIRKAVLDSALCTKCLACVAVCPQQAISEECRLEEKRCIGCGQCASVCPAGAISFVDRRRELAKIIPECLQQGTETLELHAIIADDEAVAKDWELLNDLLPDNYISMCIDRSQLSDARLIRRVKYAHGITGKRLIIQADGVPMSGSEDDYNTTLQAVAIADIIRKANIPLMILASGGTNSQTRQLADLCGVAVNGVSVGTFARKIVGRYLRDERLDDAPELISEAVGIARGLVAANGGVEQ